MLPVRFHLLGKFQAIADAADVLPRGRKTRGLLAYMATVANGTVTRDRAADLLWSDRGAEQARGSLRQAISELRAAAAILSQALSFSRDLLSFAPGSIIRDLDIIVAAIDKGDAAALDRALAHAGPFLEDLDGLSPAFDEWLQSERVRQLDRVMASCLDGLDAMIGQGRPATIQSILRSLDRLDPWNETVARIGLQVDHASNDMVSLHKRYRRLIGGLREEFGIDPSPETRSLFERLIASAPDSPSTSRKGESGGETLPPMVLVSPMGTIGGDPEMVEMAAIVTDDIRTALFNHRDLRVLALDSSDVERVERVCRDAVGAYMVSGRLRSVGGELRINLQIGEITSSTIVWSEQLRVGMDDVAAAIDHVVARAAGALAPTIDHDLATRPEIARLDRDDDAARYAKARRLIGRGRDLAEVREGVALLEDLLAANRSHVGAALLLARLYNNDLWQRVAGHDVAHFRARALELAHQASLVEPANARIKLRLAWCNLRQREWDHAEQGFREVVAAMTYDADGLNECAVGLALLGDLSEADELAQRAFALNPFAPTDYHADRGIFLMMQGDAVQAEEFFAVSGEQGPMYLAARLSNLVAQGVTDGAAFLALKGAFGGAIAQAWQRHEPAGVADVLDWADGVLPIRMPERREAFRQGLARALGQSWTAMPHNAS